MTLKDLKDIFNKELKDLYTREEAQTILNSIFIDAFGIPKLTILSQPQLELNINQSEKASFFLEELKKGIPIQYILGTAHFYGMILDVSPDVLIPRQETEELVDWIIKDIKDGKWSGAKSRNIAGLKILDVCTGGGCIALALKKHLPKSIVTGIDISDNALKVAKKNADVLKMDVTFKKMDALDLEQKLNNESFDIIVSNPPYIPSSDKDTMQKNVLMYEPHLALFVPDEEPLLFYKSIAGYAKTHKPIMLYFEIYEDFGNKLTQMLNSMDSKDIILKKDLNGKDRMLRCRYF